ncbi:hypothetical protein [Halobacillus sp. Marseille-Q1614]|uniref:hypothetical protein n=1 Tax=Halobacillus sp. Marseille-Q1614 TaxID=2709134 RepID=UPI001571473E|nr:hypothetical protein [Halobacillus sp. Marseille-Q1614]
MNERQKLVNERWKKTREMGQFKYILFYGILGYGSVFIIFSSLMDIFFGEGITGPVLIEKLIIGIVGGFIFGSLTWWLNERRLTKYKENQ